MNTTNFEDFEKYFLEMNQNLQSYEKDVQIQINNLYRKIENKKRDIGDMEISVKDKISQRAFGMDLEGLIKNIKDSFDINLYTNFNDGEKITVAIGNYFLANITPKDIELEAKLEPEGNINSQDFFRVGMFYGPQINETYSALAKQITEKPKDDFPF